MRISALREQLERGLLAFAWNEWSQLGLLTTADRESVWAQDPEALLLFTFEVARADPRLFDNVLDWLRVSEGHVSVRRLRAVARRDADAASLSGTVLDWLSSQRAKDQPAATTEGAEGDARHLFFAEGFPIRYPDPIFLRHGWLRPEVGDAGTSRPPDLRLPISFAFRLRLMLGTGARAEVMRFLLCTDAPRSTAAAITQSAMYTRRNVQEALYELTDAGVVRLVSGGWESWYGVDRDRWATLLALTDGFPQHVEWPQLLGALARVLRWLRAQADADTSDYLIASSALTLLNEIRSDMESVGIVPPPQTTAAESVAGLQSTIAQALGILRVA
jgi:hypothetical protein